VSGRDGGRGKVNFALLFLRIGFVCFRNKPAMLSNWLMLSTKE